MESFSLQEFTGHLRRWKSMILEQVKQDFTMEAMPSRQRNVGMWTKAPPAIPDIRIDGGSLTFSTTTPCGEAFFSIWMQMGQIRIGIRMPTNLSRDHANRVARLYDGQPCPRMVESEDGILFDWMFGSGFADYDAMLIATHDPRAAAAIEDRLKDILSHLFLGVHSLSLVATQD